MANSGNRYSDSWIPLAILVILLLLIYWLWNILLIFILAAFFAFIIFPVVQFFDRRLPHAFSIISVYLIIGILLIIVAGLAVPPVTEQFQQFVNSIPAYLESARELFAAAQERYVALPDRWQQVADRALSELQDAAIELTRLTIPAVVTFFRGLFALVFVPLLAFFMLLDYKGYKQMLIAIAPTPHRAVLENLLSCVGRVLWTFIKGQFVLMVAVGVLDGVGLYLVGMPYAVIFAIIGGLLELVPNFGPIATTILVGVVGMLIDPVLGIKAVLVTIAVQVLENVFLVPVVMARVVGLDPVTLAFAIFFGGSAAGILGAVIAIPIAMVVKVVVLYFYAEERDLPGRSRQVCRPPEPTRRPPPRRSRRR